MPSDAGSIPAASKKAMKSFRSQERTFILSMVLSLLLLAVSAQALTNNILKVSAQDLPDRSRLIIEASFPLTTTVEKSGSFLMVYIQVKSSFKIQQGRLESGFLKSLSWAKGSEGYTLAIEVQSAAFRPAVSTQNNLQQLTIDFLKDEEKKPEPPVPAPQKLKADEQKEAPVEPTAELRPEVSVQADAQAPSPEKRTEPPLPSKRIKTIVIDPGHGGLETGAKGKFGNLEKDITLSISRKLKGLIEKNLAFRVVLTRDKDTDVSLENRAAVANNIKADLFISIHANGSYLKRAHGSETFFLSATAPDEETRKLAYMENSAQEFEGRIEKEERDEVKLILWDLAQTAYLKESSRLADNIQPELNDTLGTANRGVKQAPFKVLTGVACPAVLVEVAFISNPEEEKELVDEAFQMRVAEAIYRGLQDYLRPRSRG